MKDKPKIPLMKREDDKEFIQSLEAVDQYLNTRKNDKGDAFSEGEIEELKRFRKWVLEKLETLNYQIVWPNGTVKLTKVEIGDRFIEITPESEERIFGQYCHSPNKKYLVVIQDGVWTEKGARERYINGKVYLFKDKKECLWQRGFISPENAFVNDAGLVFIIDGLTTCVNENVNGDLFSQHRLVSRASLIDIKGRSKFNYIFKSNFDKVLFSSKRSELMCLTLGPDRSFYLFDLSTRKIIYKAKFQREFKNWFIKNINHPFEEDQLNIWREDLFEKIRRKILEEENLKDLPENKPLSFRDLKFVSDRFTEKYERSQFEAIYTKPEFEIFEEYTFLKSRAEGKEFRGTVSDFYFDYLNAMEVTEVKQLLNTDINTLTKRSEGKFFHHGPGKIYGINSVLLKKLGRELKGIEDYIPVSIKVRDRLAKIGIKKLGDCLNRSAGEILEVKGIGKGTLAEVNSTLQKYHHRTVEGGGRVSRKV